MTSIGGAAGMAERPMTGEEKKVNNRSRLAACAISALLVGVAWAVTASSAFGYAHINSFSVSPSTSQAGGHPDVDVAQTFDTRAQNLGEAPESSNPACGCQDVFEIKNEFPTGFIGNTNAVPRCSLLSFSTRNCPVESQIGIAGGILFNGQQPIYNMEPHPGEPGLLGFFAPLINSPIFIELAGRTDSDYGLNGRTTGIFHILPLNGVTLHLWGVPGDSVHNVNRFPAPQVGTCFAPYPEPCPGKPPTPFNGAVQPFLENPTSCGAPLTMGLGLLYYDFTALHAETAWPTTTGCDQLTFNPSLTAKPTTTQADTATGLDVDLHVPQTQSPTTPSPSEIRSTRITLPTGFSINPNAADGKTVCSDEQAAFGTLNEARCPEASKMGTLTIDSTALPGPIDGAIYLGAPQPGNRYRVIAAADGYSTHVKLAGSVYPDPETGQLVTTFTDLPQSPLQEFSLHFFGSERGLLATPAKCGKYPVESEFVPWDAVLPNQTSTAYFTIDSGPNGGPCPGETRPFAPQVGAGSPDSTAGAHSPFAFRVNRADGDQNLTGLDVTTPPGFSATLAGVPYCPEAAIARLDDSGYTGAEEQASSSCPAASQIGTATAGVGAGTHPFYSPGKVFLAGPYKGSQLSLVVAIPAVQGPYDLGNVMVRAAVEVDPTTAQVKTISDPLPSIIDGIPLRLRSVLVNLSRPHFTLNPTNCSPFAVRSQVFGSEGASVDRVSPFQVANCGVLPFAPKLALKLSGGSKRTGNPALHAVLSAAEGESNLAEAVVTMPSSELLDNGHIETICTRVLFAQDNCPADAVYGHATATTPLLDHPLEGSVYLRSSDHKLPDLVADLEGQIDIEISGRIDSVKGGRLRASFESIPDAPVTKFALDLKGGRKGLLQNSEDLCKSRPKASVRMVGQSGATLNRVTALQTTCANSRRQKRAGHSSRGH
jgi:hypothetical protein